MNEHIEQLRRNVLQADATTPATQRQSICDHCVALASDPELASPFEGALGSWVDKVAKHAYQTLDRDVDSLKADGLNEEAIFELTVAAALGAAWGRRELALAALTEGYGT